jgi:hypothetical protein
MSRLGVLTALPSDHEAAELKIGMMNAAEMR